MPKDIYDIQQTLWGIADELRANSNLSSSEFSTPVLGLIFLKFASDKFQKAGGGGNDSRPTGHRRRTLEPKDFHAQNVYYLPPKAEFQYLLSVPEGKDIGKAVSDAMRDIEKYNPDLVGVLPRDYQRFDNKTLFDLLRALNGVPSDINGDVFGKIYEYFLSKFAISEGKKGGEFFTPTSIVELIVRVIEPSSGKILDPACGSGGMFVQSAEFVEEHSKANKSRVSIYGQERVRETVKLAKMNLAVHSLTGDIRESNTYYEDPHNSVGKFDYVMANPPFNVDKVDKAQIENDPRYPFGIPSVDNANYLWIQNFYSALNQNGKAGFVMPNAAGTASGSELKIRRKLVETNALSAVILVPSNFFYTVPLPVTLWFIDRNKSRNKKLAPWVLFIDASRLFVQIDRTHREWSAVQLEFLANIYRLQRGLEVTQDNAGVIELINESFPDNTYRDIAGLCRNVHIDEIEKNQYSLSPTHFIEQEIEEVSEYDFTERIIDLKIEFDQLSENALSLTQVVQNTFKRISE